MCLLVYPRCLQAEPGRRRDDEVGGSLGVGLQRRALPPPGCVDNEGEPRTDVEGRPVRHLGPTAFSVGVGLAGTGMGECHKDQLPARTKTTEATDRAATRSGGATTTVTPRGEVGWSRGQARRNARTGIVRMPAVLSAYFAKPG